MVVYPFAQRGVVLSNEGVIGGVRHGWRVVRQNASDVLLLVLIFFVIGLVFGAIAAAAILPLAVVAFGPVILRAISTGTMQWLDVALAVGGSVCLGIVAAVVNAILVTFRSTAVTLAYQEFVGKGSKFKVSSNLKPET